MIHLLVGVFDAQGQKLNGLAIIAMRPTLKECIDMIPPQLKDVPNFALKLTPPDEDNLRTELKRFEKWVLSLGAMQEAANAFCNMILDYLEGNIK